MPLLILYSEVICADVTVINIHVDHIWAFSVVEVRYHGQMFHRFSRCLLTVSSNKRFLHHCLSFKPCLTIWLNLV